MARRASLVVWMNGIRVGFWSPPGQKSSTFQYDPDWIAAPEGRVLSLSLPFTPDNTPHSGKVVLNFFDNLLPDSEAIRKRIKSRYNTPSTEAFDLLSEIGRECVGAIQLLPEGEIPVGFDQIDGEELDEFGIEAAINTSLSGEPISKVSDEEDFRISIAGAQEKTALLFHQNKWWLPRRATPTTHIFKLPLGLVGPFRFDMEDSVENEWLCSRIMQAFGLETANCEINQFGARKVLVVERFDRALVNNKWIARLPQEDFCQALGFPSEKKYESDGGPGIPGILRALDAASRADQDKRAFVKAQLVFWLLAAIDGHAKNFSIFHQSRRTYRLTPFYDVLSAWPVIGRGGGLLDMRKATLAMSLRGKSVHRKLLEMQPRHWSWATKLAGMGEADKLIKEVIDQAPVVLNSVEQQLPNNFPSRLKDKIFDGVREQINRLKSREIQQQASIHVPAGMEIPNRGSS